MHIHCFQHESSETPGTIVEWAKIHSHTITYTCFFEKNFSLLPLDDFDVLLIMGGPMNVDEEEKYPWLPTEKNYIKKAIESGKKVLGICLGSQLIAAALGCQVYKGKEKEIGFFPVSFSDNALSNPIFNHFSKKYSLFHWHGDTYDLPENAMLIASTAICQHQAYIINSQVIGLQFHLEMNEYTIEKMILYGSDELLENSDFIQTSEEIRSRYTCLEKNRKDMFVLLNKFLNSSPGPFSIP
jgi:GMP synthase-like glutamine amidotransferase